MRSSTTQSGLFSRDSLTPSRPSPDETTSKPSNSRASRRPRTMSGSSSMMRTLLRCMFMPRRSCLAEILREPHRERAPLAHLALYIYAAAVRLGDVFHERQSDPRAADRPRPHRVRPVEAVEDALPLV